MTNAQNNVIQLEGGTRIVPNRRYGLTNFIGDLTMIGVTGGLWLIWILVRELRRN